MTARKDPINPKHPQGMGRSDEQPDLLADFLVAKNAEASASSATSAVGAGSEAKTTAGREADFHITDAQPGAAHPVKSRPAKPHAANAVIATEAATEDEGEPPVPPAPDPAESPASDVPKPDPGIALVRFEMTAPTQRGRKEDAIRHRFGLSMPQYYYRLRQALDSPVVSQELPAEVAFLRKRRSRRADFHSQGKPNVL
ncbi:MAG: DUF3263 domain-containing protein [Corynebacterium sp.]|nr:DUF3263 domain-containing protein [Corynebacterium sp.]